MYLESNLPSMNEYLGNLEFRYASILVLPSHSSNYFDTIMKCLIYVKQANPTLNEFNSWFCNEYNVCKNNSYNSRKILERANLILLGADTNLRLTIEGEKCFVDDPRIIISNCFVDAYEGMLEIVILLEKNTVSTKKALFNIWYKQYTESFKSIRNLNTCKHQFNILFKYLVNFNLIIESPQGGLSLNHQIISNLFCSSYIY